MLDRVPYFSPLQVEKAWNSSAPPTVGLRVARYWQASLPLVGLLLLVIAVVIGIVTGIFERQTTSSTLRDLLPSLERVLSGGDGGLKEADKQQLSSEDRVRVRLLAARISWGLAAFLVVILGITVILASGYVSYRAGLGDDGRNATLVLGAGLLLGVILYMTSLRRNLAPALMDIALARALEVSGMPSVEGFTRWMNGLGGAALIAVIGACSVTLIASSDPSRQTAEILSAQMRRLQMLLYASAIFLTAATREVTVLYSWPSAWLADASAKDLQTLSNVAAAGFGATLTMSLLAIFMPAGAVLMARARLLASRAVENGTAKAETDWLTAHELNGFSLQSFSTLGAVLGPFLASGPLQMLLNRVIN